MPPLNGQQKKKTRILPIPHATSSATAVHAGQSLQLLLIASQAMMECYQTQQLDETKFKPSGADPMYMSETYIPIQDCVLSAMYQCKLASSQV